MPSPFPGMDPHFVFLSRQQTRPMTEIWQIPLNRKLPIVPVPLLPKDADVGLDLAQAFTSVYDSVGYDLLLNYTQPPEIPLDKKDTIWAEQLLAQRAK